MEMDEAEYKHFISMLLSEKQRIINIIGPHQIKNYSIGWKVFGPEDILREIVEASEKFPGLQKFKENIHFLEDSQLMSWHLRATIAAE